MLRALVTYTQDERRATLAGVNLFFSALLGANLGALSDVSLAEYLRMVLLLAGAVTAILTIAIARRRTTVVSTTLALAVVLTSIALTDIGGDRLADDLDRMVVTLGVWLVMLLLVRLTPVVADTAETRASAGDCLIEPEVPARDEPSPTPRARRQADAD